MDLGINKDNQKQEEKFADVDELPKTEAFQHEFTREFLVSTDEVEEGYYLLESKTGAYQMYMPINGIVNGKGFYFKTDDNSRETIHITGVYIEENIRYHIGIDYEKGNYTNNIEANLENLRNMYDYKGEFEEYIVNGNTIYFAEHSVDISEYVEDRIIFVFLAYIKSPDTDQGISITYSTQCRDSIKCKIDWDAEKHRAIKIFESIYFLD